MTEHKDWADKEQDLCCSDEIVQWFEDREIIFNDDSFELYREEFLEWHREQYPEFWGND